MNIEEAKAAILYQVKHYCERAENLYGIQLKPVVRFDLKGTTAGIANAGENLLRFNLGALEIEGGWEHLYNHTVGHEVAHLVQRNHPLWPKDRKSNPSHGVYWKTVMRDFGIPANRCHSLPLPKSRQQRKWKYSCQCRTHKISTTKHNRMRKNSNRYFCKSCKRGIKFMGQA